MSTDQSRTINPKRLAKSGECINGRVRLDKMLRISDLVQDNSGKIDFSLSFGIDDTGLCYIRSEISGKVTMNCQRCLDSVRVDIQRQSLIGIVDDYVEMKTLPEKYEPIMAADDLLSIDELVEDELLLALPLAPLHTVETCKGKKNLDQINEDAKPNPFSVLAELKRDKS